MNSYNRKKPIINEFIGNTEAEIMPPVEETETVEQMEQEEATNGEAIALKGLVFHPKKSTKSERIQLMLTPELKTAIKKEAKKNKISVNEFICSVMKAYIEAANDKK